MMNCAASKQNANAEASVKEDIRCIYEKDFGIHDYIRFWWDFEMREPPPPHGPMNVAVQQALPTKWPFSSQRLASDLRA